MTILPSSLTFIAPADNADEVFESMTLINLVNLKESIWFRSLSMRRNPEPLDQAFGVIRAALVQSGFVQWLYGEDNLI